MKNQIVAISDINVRIYSEEPEKFKIGDILIAIVVKGEENWDQNQLQYLI